MKNRFFVLSLMIVLGLSLFIFGGCRIKKEPYIKVKGIATEYSIGEELNLNNAIIEYYEDKDDDKYIEVVVESNMVTGFSTETAGTFTMTITYNNLSKQVQYTVIEKTITEHQAFSI